MLYRVPAGNPLMSIDIHPKGSRMATASNIGVEIWNMRPILDPNAEADSTVPKRLAYLTDHQATANVVRFSPCGTYLASGSDDKCIIIYELRPGRAQAAFGGSGSTASVENWRVKEVIRGHNSNVADLSWSKDSKLLASASYDNKVIIWSIAAGRHATQVHAVEHQGLAKGVAWDPLGNYLASQGDDGVRVWRTSNWSQEAYISKNLVDSPQQNYHLRWVLCTEISTQVGVLCDSCHGCNAVDPRVTQRIRRMSPLLCSNAAEVEWLTVK
jgi:protein HIRA/HIR1